MHDTLIPDAEKIHSWIEEIFNWGIRRPGYPADRQAEQYCLDQFHRFNLENVRRENVELPYWEPTHCSLTVNTDTESFSIPCFPLPHAAPADRLELPLEKFDATDPSRVKERAALNLVPLMAVPPTMVVDGGGAYDQLQQEVSTELHAGGSVLDPRGTFKNALQVLPFSAQLQAVMEPSIQAGAAAFIGVLQGYPGDSYEYYVPYAGVERPIPGVWIKSSDGERIQTLLLSGEVSIQLTVESKREIITSYNIIAELPGADDEVVVIGSHHDGPWSSAVEDASGISLVLAQAAYWSKVPAAERPHRLLFLLNAGHMVGGAGCKAFIATNQQLLEKIVLEIHLEHAASEYQEIDGQLVPTGEPETRWFFTSRKPELQQAVVTALQAEEIDRALVIAPDAFGEQPTTDGGAFYPAGVPLINYLTAPFYLFDRMDTLDKIHQPSLVPITRATIRLVDFTTGISAAEMRKGVS